MPKTDISDETLAMLQPYAVALVDTVDTTIQKVIRAYELALLMGPTASPTDAPPAPGEPLKSDGTTLIFDYRNPPKLAHTTVQQVELNGEVFPKSDNYWNTIMYTVIRKARAFGKTPDEIYDMLLVPAVTGEKTEYGYKFLKDVGLSVQGQSSDSAFRQAYSLAEKMGFKLDVFFRWQNKAEAAFPNKLGVFQLQYRSDHLKKQ